MTMNVMIDIAYDRDSGEDDYAQWASFQILWFQSPKDAAFTSDIDHGDDGDDKKSTYILQWYWSWWRWIKWWMALIPSTRSDESVVALHLINMIPIWSYLIFVTSFAQAGFLITSILNPKFKKKTPKNHNK